ncbi:unnamed protein product [Camellia sinensis]
MQGLPRRLLSKPSGIKLPPAPPNLRKGKGQRSLVPSGIQNDKAKTLERNQTLFFLEED